MAVGILYHGDPDGQCSAAIVCHHLNQEGGVKWYLFEMRYGDDIPLFEHDVTTLYILDIAFEPEIMENLANRFAVIWIDHHKTSIDKLEKFSLLEGIRDEKDAACTLTWEYLFPVFSEPTVSQLIADRDLWKFEQGDLTRNFYDFYMYVDPTPGDATWARWLVNPEITEDIETGRKLRSVRIRQLEAHIDSNCLAVDEDLEDSAGKKHHVRGLSVNVTPYSNISDAGDYILKGRGYDFAHMYYEGIQNGWLVRYNSLRSNSFNVRKLAEKHGGGGRFWTAAFVEEIREYDLGRRMIGPTA